MVRRTLLIFGAANIALIGTLIYELRTRALAEKNLYLVGTICFFGINLLLYWRLNRQRK